MKAIVHTKYGPPDVLHLKEAKKPALNEDRALVQVRAAPCVLICLVRLPPLN